MLRIGAATLVAMALLACRRERTDGVVGASSAPTAPVDAVRGLSDDASVEAAAPEPSFDGERHCGALRTIAGYMRVVPAWTDDAGYLRKVDRATVITMGDDVVALREDDDAGRNGRARGKEIPSGFGTCEHWSTTGISRRDGATYTCTSAPMPSEESASARFEELATVWRRCFARSGLREVRVREGTRTLSFAKPGPPSEHRSCSIDARTTELRMNCSRFDGDD